MKVEINKKFQAAVWKLVEKELKKGMHESAGAAIVCGVIVAKIIAAVAIARNTDPLEGIDVTCRALRAEACESYAQMLKAKEHGTW